MEPSATTTAVARTDRTRYTGSMSSPKVPAELLKSVVDYFNPRKVILFGSRARGDARPDSDHDLLVIVDDDTPAIKLHWRSIHEARRRYRRAVDIVAYRQSTYDGEVGVIGTLAHMAEANGVVVFDREHCTTQQPHPEERPQAASRRVAKKRGVCNPPFETALRASSG